VISFDLSSTASWPNTSAPDWDWRTGRTISLMVTPAVKREAVAHLKGAHEMSEPRARGVIGCDRMMVRYRLQRPDDPCLLVCARGS
jgi:hypothetical protein